MKKLQRPLVLLLGLAVLLVGPAAAKADVATQLPFTNTTAWLTVDPAGKHVFVSAGPGTSSIVVLGFDGTLVKTISGEGGASQMAVDTATHTLYVALSDATAISEIDTQTLTETTRFSTAPYAAPSSLVIAGGKLWFSCMQNGNGCLASANLNGTGLANESLTGVGLTTALAAGGSNGHLLADGDSYAMPSTLAVYDVSGVTPTLVSSATNPGSGGCEHLQDLTFDPSGANLLVACGYPYFVEALATSNLFQSAQYPIGAYPIAAAVSADGAYVAAGRETGDGYISVYPVGATTPVRMWPPAQETLLPHGLAFSPDASELFAVVSDAGTSHMDFLALDEPTVPMTETTTYLNADAQQIYAGQPDTLTVHVTGTPTGTVHLYRREGGGKTLLATGTLTNGVTTFPVSPTVTTTYFAVLDAGPGYASSTSPDATVTVLLPASTTVSLSPSQQSVVEGNQATLTAQVTGTLTGTVDLYGTPSGGTKTLVTTGHVSGGAASFNVNPTATTTYSAVLEAAPEYTSSTSQDVTVTIIPRSMPMAASQRQVAYGGKLKLTLTGVQSGKVDLFEIVNGGRPILVTTTTAGAGEHSLTFPAAPRRLTTYFAEREDQTAASNNVTVSVHPVLVLAVSAKRVSPETVRRHGERVVIGAARKPALPGEPLSLEIDRARPHGGWMPVLEGQVPVGRSGIVVGVLVIKKTGRYRAQARYRGDENFAGVKSRWRSFGVG